MRWRPRRRAGHPEGDRPRVRRNSCSCRRISTGRSVSRGRPVEADGRRGGACRSRNRTGGRPAPRARRVGSLEVRNWRIPEGDGVRLARSVDCTGRSAPNRWSRGERTWAGPLGRASARRQPDRSDRPSALRGDPRGRHASARSHPPGGSSVVGRATRVAAVASHDGGAAVARRSPPRSLRPGTERETVAMSSPRDSPGDEHMT